MLIDSLLSAHRHGPLRRRARPLRRRRAGLGGPTAATRDYAAGEEGNTGLMVAGACSSLSGFAADARHPDLEPRLQAGPHRSEHRQEGDGHQARRRAHRAADRRRDVRSCANWPTPWTGRLHRLPLAAVGRQAADVRRQDPQHGRRRVPKGCGELAEAAPQAGDNQVQPGTLRSAQKARTTRRAGRTAPSGGATQRRAAPRQSASPHDDLRAATSHEDHHGKRIALQRTGQVTVGQGVDGPQRCRSPGSRSRSGRGTGRSGSGRAVGVDRRDQAVTASAATDGQAGNARRPDPA